MSRGIPLRMERRSPSRAGSVARIAVVAAVGLLASCGWFQKQSPKNKEAERRAAQLNTLQLEVMRFADEYEGRLRESVNRFQAGAKSPEERLAAQNWKLSQAESAYMIASGPNPFVNAVDMVVLATLSRMVLDDLWVAELYGDRARPLQETHRSLEQGAWKLVANELTDSQQAQLRDVISAWRAQNPNVRAVASIHFSDFAKMAGQPKPGEERSKGNLFSIVGLDPLTQLDPAVREVAQARQLAERSIYYLQRAPALLNMQVEKISYQTAVMQETKTALASLERVSHIGTAAEKLADELPDVLARERQALIAQLMRELDDKQAAVAAISGDLRTTLEAGTETVKALNEALAAVDRITARYPAKAPVPGEPPGRPFDIREYTEMVRELAATARELKDLAGRADAALPALHAATQDATGAVDRLLGRLFWKLLILIVVAILGTLAAALAYRAIAPRFRPAGPSRDPAPRS
jgi:hypothetical protein